MKQPLKHQNIILYSETCSIFTEPDSIVKFKSFKFF
jgi:hypothetical protein